MATNKRWEKEDIKHYLETDDAFLCRAMLKIYDRQTADEKSIKDTNHQNGVGFNGVDARILSSFSEFYKERGFLSNKQIAIARKKMMKYAGQLADIANAS